MQNAFETVIQFIGLLTVTCALAFATLVFFLGW